MEQLQHVLQAATSAITTAIDLNDLDQVRLRYLGKKGEVTDLLKQLGQLSAEQRPVFGQAVNLLKNDIQALLDQKHEQLSAEQLEKKLAQEKIDVTMPGRGEQLGTLHPVTQTRMRIEQLFTQLGFTIATGPEIETEDNNFTALNIPEHHPARASHDTFYVDTGHLLRTHTSPVQIRYMLEHAPPFRIIAPGRVYRCDSDLTHTPMFHQVEGLVVGEEVTFADLKGLLHHFLQTFFEREFQLRFRPNYFPFTEPSAEVDMQCVKCEGKGCRICKQTGWLEILGCGMVHPKVLQYANIDPERYTGFAFGMGIDRIAMLRYGITDLRMLFENDIRFLQQF